MKRFSTCLFSCAALCAICLVSQITASFAQKKPEAKSAAAAPLKTTPAATKTIPAATKTTPMETKTTAPAAPVVKTPPAFVLPKLEAEVLAEINLVRQNPAAYAAFLEEWKKNYDGNFLKMPNRVPVVTSEGTAAIDEAILFLKQASPASPVSAMRGLGSAADTHLRDLIGSGKTGHTGSNGSLPHQRVEAFGEWSGEVKELISYFAPNARQIVFNYLIDDGNRRRPHREALLKDNLKSVGIVTGDSQKFTKLCVVVMAESFTEN